MSVCLCDSSVKPSVPGRNGRYGTNAIGEPESPSEFVWRGRNNTVTGILLAWRETGRCHHGSPEMYVRKHWYEGATACGSTIKVYFDRQPYLVLEILCRQVERRIQRNLSYGYQSREAVLGRVRGRIDLLNIKRHRLLDRGKLV